MDCKEFPRTGTSFSINYWGADMVLGKIMDNKEETFDEKFIAMFQDILPWLSYGWIVNGQELAYVVPTDIARQLWFSGKGTGKRRLMHYARWLVFPGSPEEERSPQFQRPIPKERSVKGDEMNSDDKEKQTAGSMVFHIGSVQGNVGNVSNSQVNFNDYRSVHQLLMDHNITKQDRRELEDIMDELKTAPPEKKSSWVERGEKWFVSHKEALGACAEIIRKALGLGT